MRCYFLVTLILLFSATFSNGIVRQSLNGANWVASIDSETQNITVPATVPGGIFSDLMNDGQIEDIFYGYGDSNYSWVGESDWTYSTTFEVDDELLANKVISLVFEGLDTFATILINGNKVGISENMFVRYDFDIKEYLQVGPNELTVQFVSAVTKAAALGKDPDNPYDIPPDCPVPEFHGICYANRIRKMQASFSWDWGPAFASVGIWRNVYLEAFNNAAISHVLVTPIQTTDKTQWALKINTYFNPNSASTVSGTLEVSLQLADDTQSNSVYFESNLTEYYELLVTTSLEIPADIVDLWWPNGYGEQPLYNLTVTYTGSDDQDSKTVRTAFRTIEIVQNELSGGGIDFYFQVNGYPIFAKGANEIPINVLPERGQDPDAVKLILQSAKDVNMNMIRVWGGGVYESDYFYDLADEYGILIWQDFMFACALYPADDVFLNNVILEVRHQVKRLGSHPSIALWAGNNENEGALSGHWWYMADYNTYVKDYVKLYITTIKSELLRILPDLVFIPSSPTNGVKSESEGYVSNNPGSDNYGDVHFYDYSRDSWEVSTFPIPRFSSEYGYQSLPSIESWLTATNNLDDLKNDTKFLNSRQHHPGGNPQNVNLIRKQLSLPDASSPHYVETLVYYSQIVQAQSIKTETEHYRSFKGRFDQNGRGNTMGALYWQLNDVWVAPTWSSIDFTGRWKMLHYHAQDFFKPLITTGRITGDNQLEVYAILDDLKAPDYPVKGLLSVYKWDSLSSLVAVEFPFDLDTTKAVLVTTVDAETTLETAGCGSNYTEAKQNCFFHLQILDLNNNLLAPSNYVFPAKLKDSNLANANVKIESITQADQAGKVFNIVLTTDTVALFVWLDSHNIIGRFSENGFLQVESTKTVTFTSDAPITLGDLDALTVTYLQDPVSTENNSGNLVNLSAYVLLLFLCKFLL